MMMMKDYQQGYSNFRKCIAVALLFVLDVALRIKISYIYKKLNAIIIQCNIKGN